MYSSIFKLISNSLSKLCGKTVDLCLDADLTYNWDPKSKIMFIEYGLYLNNGNKEYFLASIAEYDNGYFRVCPSRTENSISDYLFNSKVPYGEFLCSIKKISPFKTFSNLNKKLDNDLLNKSVISNDALFENIVRMLKALRSEQILDRHHLKVIFNEDEICIRFKKINEFCEKDFKRDAPHLVQLNFF